MVITIEQVERILEFLYMLAELTYQRIENEMRLKYFLAKAVKKRGNHLVISPC